MNEALLETDLLPDPIAQFRRWYEEAERAGQTDVEAMALATADSHARPSVRMVLLKGCDARGFVFFTNYESRKGRDLAKNPFASVAFFWTVPRRRQVRIEGTVGVLSEGESDAYFHSRPLESRISACASAQSGIAPDRAALDARAAAIRATIAGGKPLARPSNWGGYLITPDSIEFWQAHPHRLHDRLRFQRNEEGVWRLERLWP